VPSADNDLEKLRQEVGDDFDAWVRRVSAAFDARLAQGAWPDHIVVPERPTGWDDAGPWQRILIALAWNGGRLTEIRLVAAFMKRTKQAWEKSVNELIETLLALQVLDPSFADIPSDEVIDDEVADHEVDTDGDPELIHEFRRLRESRPRGGIRAASDVTTEIALVLTAIATNLISNYIFAGLQVLHAREQPTVTVELTGDQASAFAEMYAAGRSNQDLILVNQTLEELYEPAGKRNWRKRVDRWHHVFVGLDKQYEIEISMDPGQEFPALVRVATSDSAQERYRDLASTGKHDRLPSQTTAPGRALYQHRH
jgi:hypothetical protein